MCSGEYLLSDGFSLLPAKNILLIQNSFKSNSIQYFQYYFDKTVRMRMKVLRNLLIKNEVPFLQINNVTIIMMLLYGKGLRHVIILLCVL